ncbi:MULTISPECIES: dihydroxyacetone kinase phosphoryl donor subunit DhaM [unclassified Haladaptatus]|uniref:dihydroxyacetone kinase phosphoryl donor subunit DhaM n=1 Tax=unclassified Haladaptatus TaxID=2622732 RepID=UPI00209BF161|nr:MULTISPECIES: dihydroxyacetone kinase phosphoryl donor subunit DhaM [unclassified Haladaptatus]MCO8245776.1 dihydroxyacetone kinase phosphoryl donor subunit DhaM [Haladaptatus sp. AB643]MCO8256123.1 dihydroxyacetone kinase phosphoryl donor subunit DhaM [Haladaptatus sp. AB618]
MIGLVVVSHSEQAAKGIREVAAEMAGDVPIEAVGGDPDGGLGTSTPVIQEALDSLADEDGVVVLVDLGSAVMNTELAIEMADVEAEIADAPILEGAVNAAVTANSPKATVESVLEAAEEAGEISKL